MGPVKPKMGKAQKMGTGRLVLLLLAKLEVENFAEIFFSKKSPEIFLHLCVINCWTINLEELLVTYG
jgi:hypothetical protein